MLRCYTVALILFTGLQWSHQFYVEDYFTTQENFVEELEDEGHIKSPEVKNAMLQVDRYEYKHRCAYEDCPEIAPDPPYTIPLALETLKDFLKPGSRVLDAGVGSGYLATCMAIMVGPEGKVIGETINATVKNYATMNIERNHSHLLTTKNIELYVGDTELGLPEYGPYSCIHYTDAGDEIPTVLFTMLDNPGKLMVPLKEKTGYRIIIYDKLVSGKIKSSDLMRIPFTDRFDE